MLNLSSCFWRNRLRKTINKSTVYMGNLRHLLYHSIGWSVRDGKNKLFLTIGIFRPFHIVYFSTKLSNIWRCHAERNWKFRVFWDISLILSICLKNNSTKLNLILADSHGESWISRELVDNATAGRDHGLNTFYVGHNLLHWSQLGMILSCKTRALFPSSFTVTWCKSVRLLQNWDSYQTKQLVLRRNICFQRSFNDCLVTTKRQ